MNNQRIENLEYITGLEEENKEGKCKQYSSRNSPKNNNGNSKTIDYSDSKKNKKVISIVFPTIQTDTKMKNSKLFSSSQKYMKLNKNENKNEQIYKSHKNMLIPNSKFKYYSKINTFDKKNNINNNNNENDSKDNNINHYCMTCDEKKNMPNINKIECSLNFDNSKNNNKLNNNNIYKNYNTPSSASKNQISKQKLYNQLHSSFVFDKFLKKELKMEERIKLFPYFLERLSPRLLHKKNTNKKNNDNTNDKNSEYRYSTIIYNNKVIPYIEALDVKKLSNILPPIIIGSRFNVQEKSSDITEKEKYYNEIGKLGKERKKGISENKKISKKGILQMMKAKKLLKYKFLINKTQKTISSTKGKINKDYNKLKISLNQFDDWNYGENDNDHFEF